MKKILVITLMSALMVGFFSFTALGADKMQGPGGPAPQMRGPAGPGPEKDMGLNLTPEQRQKIEKIQRDFMKETLDLRFDLKKKKAELRLLWTDRPLNQAAIEAKTKEAVGLRIQLVNKKEAMLEKIKAVLTPEQLKLFDEKMAKYPRGFDGPGRGPRGYGRGERMDR